MVRLIVFVRFYIRGVLHTSDNLAMMTVFRDSVQQVITVHLSKTIIVHGWSNFTI